MLYCSACLENFGREIEAVALAPDISAFLRDQAAPHQEAAGPEADPDANHQNQLEETP